MTNPAVNPIASETTITINTTPFAAPQARVSSANQHSAPPNPIVNRASQAEPARTFCKLIPDEPLALVIIWRVMERLYWLLLLYCAFDMVT